MRKVFNLAVLMVILWAVADNWGHAEKAIEAPFDYARGVVAGVELHQIRNLILAEKTMNGRLPTEREFPKLVQKRLKSQIKDPGLDSWGRRYRYQRIAQGFRLISLGPDGRYKTSDDLILQWKEAS